MKNTKFRKRALLSSVAMLLVALVALGSATFAWFTENPVVSSQGITAKGQTSIGLKIHTTTDTSWKDSANLMNAGTANSLLLSAAYAHQETDPANSITWLKASAATKGEWTPTGNWQAASGDVIDASTSQTTIGTGIYHEQIFIKTTGGSAANVNMTGLTVSAADDAEAIKAGVTVLVAVDGEIKAMKKIGSDAIKNYATPSAGTAVGSNSGTKTMYTTGNVLMGEADDGSTAAKTLVIDVYVYLDGTDAQVYTDNVSAKALLKSVNLQFAKA